MHIKDRLSLTKYYIGSIINIIISLVFVSELRLFPFIVIFHVTIIINQLLLMYLVKLMLFSFDNETDNGSEEDNKVPKLLGLFIGKTIVIGLGFYILYLYIPHHLMPSVATYIFQLLILTLSIKR